MDWDLAWRLQWLVWDHITSDNRRRVLQGGVVCVGSVFAPVARTAGVTFCMSIALKIPTLRLPCRIDTVQRPTHPASLPALQTRKSRRIASTVTQHRPPPVSGSNGRRSGRSVCLVCACVCACACMQHASRRTHQFVRLVTSSSAAVSLFWLP